MDQAQTMFFLANAWLKPVEYPTSALPLEEEIAAELNGVLPDLPRSFDNKVTDISQLNLEADESEMIKGNIDETEKNDNTEQVEQRVDIVEFPLDDLGRKLHRRIRIRMTDSCAELSKSKEQTV
ncbi:hypothetical protein G6F46_008350 [Rhizopus delemar]|uniref:Uncharacterized protein n=2 Tax=Rhizopus TaxID=4842 RepID=A0A9P7CMR2_9FUNG|nr:hypothetical protein G6F55_007299 [Rhizopus delemar]KAG1540225.1 hypothetical protein G6F51_008650 [Rhizopus arrhizus]KAG1487612.1 hypothetical protein G6F54_012552 [Rhizopus delemar]KAG1506472.1 hypothetical protein G6F52_011884 [Rhizopus delemar]KAG1515728.1 hypothetical protein G6F53_002694 [Rhizopus delemar]